MRRSVAQWAAVLWIPLAAAAMGHVQKEEEVYINLWVAKVEGGEREARRVARDAGFTYQSQAAGLDDYYVYSRADQPPRSSSGGHHHTENLLQFKQVEWAERQKLIKIADRKRPASPTASVSNYWQAATFYLQPHRQGDTSKLGSFSTRPNPGLRPAHSWTMGLRTWWKSAYAGEFNDPAWHYQWYLHDYRTTESAVLDLNVVPVYRMGYTGRGVTVAAVDTGVKRQNRDIDNNYVDELSQDYLEFLPTADPSPGLGMITRHGTQVAGVIAMEANNSFCGVGIAYNANITGIKFELTTDSTDLHRAAALSHRNDAIDIYSCSWTNDNDGTRLVKRQPLTYRAIEKAVTRGRKGKGNLFVFCAGNHRGHPQFDSCAFDSLHANPHIIVVAAADQGGVVTSYSEPCAAVMVTSYSGDDYTDGLVAPEVDADCGARFSGTSAATPAVSAVIALTLEANPELTYRDVMHLITMSAEVAPLAASPGVDVWKRNGAGFWVSDDFGFGLLNAENMVRLALNWTNVPRRVTCMAHSADKQVFFGPNNTQRIAINTDGCQGEANSVVFLEQVELESTIYHGGGRGKVTLRLISPEGTNTTLIRPRYRDKNQWYDKWNILSVQNWGENPKGTWYVEVAEVSGIKREENTNVTDSGPYAKYFSLTMHGTGARPAHAQQLPRNTYTGFRLADGTTSWQTS